MNKLCASQSSKSPRLHLSALATRSTTVTVGFFTPALDAADVGPIQTSLSRKRFLRPAASASSSLLADLLSK